MVDRGGSSRASSKLLSITKSRKSSSASSEFDEEYRVRLEGKYLGNGLEIRPPSGTNHQQPGSHLSIDTRLSELSLANSDHLTDDGTLHSSNHTSASSKKSSPYRVLVEKPNCYIRSPFKQGYQVPNKGTTQVVDPSIQLKKVTQDSIDRVRQQFRRPRPPPRSFVNAPRLRKAKLKTTGRPISGSGPSIKECRGIQGGARVTSRPTPQRFYDYEDPLHPRSPSLRPASPTELHRPESSIHCTSRVPSEYGDISLSDQTIETCSHVIDSGSRRADKPDVVNGSFEHSDLIDLSSSIDLERSLDPITDHLLNSDYLVNNETDLHDADRSKFQTTEHHLSDDSLENHDIIERKENGTSNDHELSCDGLSDSEEKSNSNKSTSIKRNGNCKPFSDNIDNNDDDNDDDDDDDDDESQSRLHKRTLLSSYNNRSTLKASNQNGDKSNSGKNDTHNGNKMGNENKMGNKARNDNANSIEREENSLTCQTKLFTTLPLKNKVEKHKSKKGESLLVPDGCAHIVNATNSEDFPVMTVHVRGKVEKNEHQNTRTEDDIHEQYIDSNKSDYKDRPDYDGDMNDDDDDYDLDTDRIPSAIIWKNIDQLNLSMNASSHPLNDVTKFSSKARKVQSAGPRGRPTTELSNGGSSKLQKTKPRSRASSGKTKRTKVKPEEIDKAEILRRYLSEESKKFSENLPGYFTEQFNIIQESKRGKYGDDDDDEEEEEFISKALVKYEEQDDKDNQNKECNESAEEKESSLYSIEVEDPTSSGVFFTIESTTNSTFDVDSLSEQTVGESSDTREFSDDTGFETMPGSGLSGRKNTGTKMDSSTTMDAGMGSILDDDLKHDIKDEYLRFVNHEDLEVIAKAKHLTDPRSRNLHYKSCPYEPLNFTINARPPPGYLFYFAYGVDMNAKRMSLYLRRDYKRLWGVLFGFKLRFNKRGSSSDAGGFANVEFSPGNSVEGCVYTITDADLSMLDNCMGYPKHYCRVVLPVWMSNCHEPGLHGVAQYCVPAVLYVAQQQWLEPGKTDYLDCSYSISQCLKASDILTPNYVEYLNQLAAV